MKCGNCELTSVTCKLSYVEKTSRSLKQRYQVHTTFIKQSDLQSAYAVHILYNNHEYGLITIMSILIQVTKTKFLTNNFTSNYIVIKTHTGTKWRGKQPNVPTDLWPSYYVTPLTQYRSVLQLRTYFLDLSTQLTLLNTRPLPSLVRAINIALSNDTFKY